MPNIIQVTIPGNIFDYLDYLAPEYTVEIGMRVIVKLRNKDVIGLVSGRAQVDNLPYKLRPIEKLIDGHAILPPELLKLAHWISDYYQSPLSEVLRAMLPKKVRLGMPLTLPTTSYYNLIKQDTSTLSGKKQLELVDFVTKQKTEVSWELLKQQGFSKAPLQTLLNKNILIETKSPITPPCSSQTYPPLELNEEQLHVVDTISQALDTFQTYLLFGITGSGKTEVYFHIMEKVLSSDKQVLILVPEIGLTPQFIQRVFNRFNHPVATLHSNLNDTERLTNWLWCSQNQARIVIGTRSAVFTPLANLGLVIIDEEHDLSFKQQDGVRFSGRDVAIKRAYDKNIPVILGSGTPALETLYNAESGKYKMLKLTKRARASEPVYFRIADLRNQKTIDGICNLSLARIKAHLEMGNQVMVFINRRGYAPIIICHQCAWMADCQHCSAHLTIHAKQNVMRCHHCGYTRRIPNICESCQSPELIPVGAGTERIHQYLSTCFPDYKTVRIDRDTTKGKMSLQKALQEVDQGKVDILVGTQLLAKGHHFKKLNLVVVVDADAGFFSQDFRALERLGQTLIQVAGRAGREGKGEVVVQTHQPDDSKLNTLIQKGYQTFGMQLLTERETYLWPPYSFLALCRARGSSPQKIEQFFIEIKRLLNKIEPHLILLGPAPAPMERKAGEFQLQLLIRSGNRAILLSALKNLRQNLRSKEQQSLISSLKFSIDMDPLDLG